MRTGHLLGLVALLMFTLAAVGCNTSTAPNLSPPTQNTSGHDHDGHDHDGHDHDGHDHDGHDHAGHDHAGHDHAGHDEGEVDPNLIATNLAKLTEEDRLLAEKQEICFVGGEALGSMGTPEKVDVDGTPIFICCKSCEREILNNKEKYLAMVNGTASEETGNEEGGEGDSSE